MARRESKTSPIVTVQGDLLPHISAGGGNDIGTYPKANLLAVCEGTDDASVLTCLPRKESPSLLITWSRLYMDLASSIKGMRQCERFRDEIAHSLVHIGKRTCTPMTQHHVLGPGRQ